MEIKKQFDGLVLIQNSDRSAKNSLNKSNVSQ